MRSAGCLQHHGSDRHPGSGPHTGSGRPDPLRRPAAHRLPGARRPGGTGPYAAGGLALACIAALGMVTAGCSTGATGARDEGAAVPPPVAGGAVAPRATSTPSGGTVDPVLLLLRDPRVSKRVKARVRPCVKGTSYPVDASYGDLTGSPAPDVVVNVMTCGSAVGIGTYVYRAGAERAGNGGDAGSTVNVGRYKNVFADEEPAVSGTIDRGELVVTHQVYSTGDPLSYPSAEEVVTYTWSGARFTQHYRVLHTYSRAVGGDAPVPEASPPNEN